MGIGAVLTQLNKSNVEQPLAYYNRLLSKPKRKYAGTHKEMLALVNSFRHFRCYLIGKKFKVHTDHSALQWLRTLKEPVCQVVRWIERLADPVEDGPDTQFCAKVPHAAKQEILELAHYSAAGGHCGVQKTIDEFKQRFYWNHLAKDVHDWCMKCPNCNRNKTTKSNRASMQPIYTGEPFEPVAMDIIGPLPRTERGNCYILTVVDHFTKHVEAYPLQDQEAVFVARVFHKEFVSRYGVPYVIHTDQGTNFE